jgi:hypothetical protein
MTDIEQRIRAYVEHIDGPRPNPNLPRRLARATRRRRILQTTGTITVVAVVAGAIGLVGARTIEDSAPTPSDAPTVSTPSKSQAHRSIITAMTQSAIDPIAWYADDATDYLPNRLFAVGKRPPVPLSDRVVVADIVDVVEGEAYTAHNKHVDDWGDEDVYGYKTVIVQSYAEPLIGDGPTQTISASLRVASSDDLATWRTGLRSFSPVVAFLTDGSSFDDADYTLAGDGATLLPIGGDGRLHAPFRQHWLDDADTLDQLRAEARRPAVTQTVPPGRPIL